MHEITVAVIGWIDSGKALGHLLVAHLVVAG